MIKVKVKNTHQHMGYNFIALACGFQSDIEAKVDGMSINAKSIMKVSLIEKATEVEFTIVGEDEKLAASAIEKFYQEK